MKSRKSDISCQKKSLFRSWNTYSRNTRLRQPDRVQRINRGKVLPEEIRIGSDSNGFSLFSQQHSRARSEMDTAIEQKSTLVFWLLAPRSFCLAISLKTLFVASWTSITQVLTQILLPRLHVAKGLDSEVQDSA